MAKLFVWDFHGTLEKGNENASREITNKVLRSLGYKQRLSRQQAREYYGKKWFEYYELLLPEEPHKTHLDLQKRSFEWPSAELIVSKHMRPNDYAVQVVKTIKKVGNPQLLLSNTTAQALPIFIRLVGLSNYFNETNAIAVASHAQDPVQNKMDVLENYIKDRNLQHNIVVVGDSLKDMELAQRENSIGYFYRHPGLEISIDWPNNIKAITDLREILQELKAV